MGSMGSGELCTEGPSDGSRDIGAHRILGGAPLLLAIPGGHPSPGLRASLGAFA